MFQVNQITYDAKQSQRMVLPDGSFINMDLEYKPLQFGWFITSLVYGDFTLQNVRICTSPNLLRQFKNQLPFGMAIYVKDNLEPFNIQDFSSGNAKMFILTAAEVHQYEEYLSG